MLAERSIYALTERGRELVVLPTPLAEWGNHLLAEQGVTWRPPEPRRSAQNGSREEVRLIIALSSHAIDTWHGSLVQHRPRVALSRLHSTRRGLEFIVAHVLHRNQAWRCEEFVLPIEATQPMQAERR